MKAGRVPALDLLRFLAASMVVLYHFTYRPVIHGRLDEAAFGAFASFGRFGYLGVELFFMISGFVILWSAHGRTAGEFVASRLARLYPTFWVCVLLTAAVLLLAGPPAAISGRTLAANLTMIPGQLGAAPVDGVYWTLFVEMKFYLLVFLVLVFRGMNRLEPLLGLWLAAAAACVFLPNARLLASASLYPFGPYFISGCLFYLIRVKGASPYRLGAVAVSCLLGVVCAVRQQAEFIQGVDGTSGAITGGLVVLFHAAFLAVALVPELVPESAWWLALGSLTYPLYLLHNQAGKKLWSLLPPFVSAWPALFLIGGAVYLLSWAVASFVERHAHKPVRKGLLRLAAYL